MTPTWFWPEAHAPLYHSLGRILKVLQGIPLTGWEVSCKFSPHGWSAGRLVVGFAPRGISRNYLARFPANLGMPPAVAAIFAEQWPRCRQIGLACEAGADSAVFKVYLEYPRPLSRSVQPPSQVIRGFKWPVDKPADWHETGYWCLNGMTAAAAHDRLRRVEATAQELALLHSELADILLMGLKRRAGEWRDFQMLEIREADSPRNALGLRFYESGLIVGDLAPGLKSLGANWRLPSEDIAHFLSVASNREIGWLHAGIGSDSLPFLNLYCQASRYDAQQGLLLSDATRTSY